MSSKEALGIDIGGVIISKTTQASHTFFRKEYLKTPEVRGAIDGIAEIVRTKKYSSVYLVSKCGEKTALKTLDWLQHRNFFKRTSIKLENIIFCRKAEDKAKICKEKGIRVFIDDRYNTLAHIDKSGLAKNLILFCPTGEEKQSHSAKGFKLHHAADWKQILALLC